VIRIGNSEDRRGGRVEGGGRTGSVGSGFGPLAYEMGRYFDTAYGFTQFWEGGGTFHEVQGDPGGATKFGISYRFLKDLPLPSVDFDLDGILTWQDVRAMREEQAREIFRRYFWNYLTLDRFRGPLAVVMFDTAVNVGRTRTVRWLQQGLALTADLVVDGVMGPRTVEAAILADMWATIRDLLSRRRRYYYDLAGDTGWAKKFVRGWIRRTERLEAVVGGMP